MATFCISNRSYSPTTASLSNTLPFSHFNSTLESWLSNGANVAIIYYQSSDTNVLISIYLSTTNPRVGNRQVPKLTMDANPTFCLSISVCYRVNASPDFKSTTCLTSTESDSLWLGGVRLSIASVTFWVVIALKWARRTV